MIKHELDTVQQVKEEIEELREYVDRLEEHTQRRKLRLLEQVTHSIYSDSMPFVFYDFLQYIFMISIKKKRKKNFFLFFVAFLSSGVFLLLFSA